MSALRQLRVIAGIEGLSYVLLVFVGMPLKYAWSIPQPSRMLGMAHGILFVLYVIAVVRAARAQKWERLTIAQALAASVVPFATITLDASLREEERR